MNRLTLEKFAGSLVAKNKFIKASFGGFQGSGKTRTATEFIIGAYKEMKCTKPILCLDNEKGSRFLIPIFKKAGIEALVKDTVNLADVIQAFEYLKAGEIDFLFIDSLTKVYYKFVKDYKQKNNRSFMRLNDWGKILPAWQEEFSDRFVNTEGNIIFTGRGGFEYEKEDDQTDEEGKVTEKGSFVKSGFKMKIAGETPYETDLNIWMQLEKGITKDNKITQKNVAYILKDRSDTINGKSYEMPKYKNFRPIVRFILGLPIGEVPEGTLNENYAPGSDADYFERKQRQKIEIEKIAGVFDKYGLGDARGKADKQLKTSIIEKIFGTTSLTEIEKMPYTELNFRKQELEELFEMMKDVENPFDVITSYRMKEAV
jgi:AAA domain